MIRKIKLAALVTLLFLTHTAQAQVKFRVKKLNSDSLVALIPEKEGPELVEALNLLSNVICRTDIDSSLHLANRAVRLSEKMDYQKGLAYGYYNLGNGYFLLDSLRPTILNYMKACRIYEDLEPTMEYGRSCLQLALMNYFTRGPEESPPYLNKAIRVFNSIGDQEDKYNINFTMAVTNNVVYPPKPDSIKYYGFKAITFIDTAVDHTELAYVYSEIGEGYSPLYTRPADTADLTIALSWFFKALELPTISNDLKITLYLNIASTFLGYHTEQHTSDALLYLEKARSMPDNTVGVYDQKPAIFQMLGAIHFKKRDYEKTISLYKQGIQIAEDRLSNLIINEYPEPIHGFNNRYYIKYDRQLMYQGIYDSWLKLGRFEKALEYFMLSKEAADEIFTEQNLNLITMLEAVSIDDKNKSQIELLASENELHKLRVRQSRTWLIILGGFVMIFVLVSLLFIRQRKIRTEHKTLLREQKLLHEVEIKNMESKKLKELDHLKSQFFANISHEFRTPLTLILSPAEKLLSKITDENTRNDLLLIHRYARRLRRLINQLLNLSKLEAGELKLITKKENIIKLVKGFTQSFESFAKQRQIKLLFTTESEELIAYADRNKLEIILNNLLSNAFKFTREGGSVNVAVKPILDDNNEIKEVQITVSDSGIGIPEDKQEKIFERFYLVDDTNSPQHEGTGIGLALAKELIELHRGEILVESKTNEGTTFRVLLPVDVSEDDKKDFKNRKGVDALDALIEESQEPIFNYQELKKKIEPREDRTMDPVILVVEDNPDLRAHICYHLSDEYNIIEASDGEKGLLAAKTNIPDLIISDVMMPKMDGFELSKMIRANELTSHIPVVLLTARASKESRIEGLETGADDFITKPFDIDELLVRVKNLIVQRKRLSTVLEKKIQKSHHSLLIDFEDSGITSMDEQFLQKVIKILKEHHPNPEFKIHDFGQYIGLSVAQLNRKVKALTGKSTADFIRTYRLTQAAGLIQKKSATITEIAYDVGFNSPSYFSECFKIHFGKLPSEFNGKT